MLRNIVLASLIAVSATFAVLPASADKPEKPRPERKWDSSKWAEMHQKHQEELHKKLNLTADQEAAWQTFVEKTKMTPPAHRDGGRAEMEKLTAPERMEKMLERMKEGQSRMEQHLAALKEFYGQLTPEQKSILDKSFAHRGPGGPGAHHRGAEGQGK